MDGLQLILVQFHPQPLREDLEPHHPNAENPKRATMHRDISYI